MKTLYEVNWHYNNDLLVCISVTPIKVLREGILPGCSAVSITAVDKKENEKGPCHQYETQMMYNAATKTMMPSRVCVLRGEWVEESHESK